MRGPAVAAALALALALSALAAAAPPDLLVEGPATVGRFEKIEFRIPAAGDWPNPFDPADVDVTVDFKSPSGRTVTLPAFFMQPYERGGGGGPDWQYPAGLPGFRARFAPDEPGAWTAKARIRDKAGAAESKPVPFACAPSERKGYVRVSARDPRWFELGDGTPFFPVGQNVAFVGDTQYVKPATAESVFRKLAANGANYARVWVCCEDWATAIEARKSAWGRSWAWKPPFVAAPGFEGKAPAPLAVRVAGGPAVPVDPSRPVCIKPATAYVLSAQIRTEGEAALEVVLGGKRLGDAAASRDAWAGLQRPFTAEAGQWRLPKLDLRATGTGAAFVRSLSLKEASGGAELLWEAAVDRPVRGHLNQPDCGVVDGLVEAAERTGLRLQLTLVTRDLYMKDLEDETKPGYGPAVESVKRLLRYAVARWGWSTHIACWEYFNEMNPGAPTDRAYREWGEYLEQIDPYRHVRATSDWGPNPRSWAHPKLDYADMHWYLRPAWGELSKDAAAAALDRAKALLEKTRGKPALLGEFGLADDTWGLSPYMAQDKEGIHFHNALWASALSGLSGTALFWWWDQIDKMDLYKPYRGISAYVADIPFTTAGLQPTTAKPAGAGCRVVGLQGKDRAYLWIQNLQSTWWKAVVEKTAPSEVKGETVAVEGLEPGTYGIQWWDTIGGKVVKEETATPAGGRLTLAVPAFTRDIAVKVVRR
jgi:hypothetical protein